MYNYTTATDSNLWVSIHISLLNCKPFWHSNVVSIHTYNEFCATKGKAFVQSSNKSSIFPSI